MALAWDDVNKRVIQVELREVADGVIEPKDPAHAALLCCSRRLNPEALTDMQALVGANVPAKYWIQAGNRVREMTPAEKAAADAKPAPVPPPDPPDPT